MRVRCWACAAVVSVCLWFALAALVGCGGGGFLSSLGIGTGGGGGGQSIHPASGPLGPREEFAHLLNQLQWIFLGLGFAGVVASIWVPLISTRHALGAVAIGIGVAVVKPWLIALYWPAVILLALAALSAAWPYLVAAYAWFQSRFRGKPLPTPTVGVVASLKSLVMPRAAAAGRDPGNGGVSVGAGPPDAGSSSS